MISYYLFLSYILTQTSFFLGLYTFRGKGNIVINKVHSKSNKYTAIIAFYFFSFVYLLCQGIIYKLKGIPLFMDSRLETFSAGGGSGILGRIADVSSIFSIYAFFLIIKFNNFK